MRRSPSARSRARRCGRDRSGDRPYRPRLHPDRPYDDPRVGVHIDDGRAFLRRSTDRYDLIVFAMTDSLTLVTSTANVRLESFLFTEESLRAARDHLDDDGVFVMFNAYRQPWLVAKLQGMAATVFGHEPLLWLEGTPGGDRRRPGVVEAVAQGQVGADVDVLGPSRVPRRRLRPTTGRSCTCGTPRSPVLPCCTGSAATIRRRGDRHRLESDADADPARLQPALLRPRIAFLLLETRSLVTFSLLFGTTWSVNALVFFAILLSVLVAIGISAASASAGLRRCTPASSARWPWPGCYHPSSCSSIRPRFATSWPPASPSRRSSSPTSCSRTCSGTPRRPTWHSRATCSARWSVERRVPRPALRLPVAALHRRRPVPAGLPLCVSLARHGRSRPRGAADERTPAVGVAAEP